MEAARDFRRTLLDRADGVLREQGVSLEWHSVPEGHRLAWRDGPRNPISLPLGPPAPRHATALPEGLLRRRLLESVGHAALLEVVSVLGSAQRVRLMDREDKTVCWVSVERGAAAGHEGKRRLRLHQRVIVVPVKGYGALAARVADHLSEQPGWEASREALFDEAKRRMVRSEATGFAARITSLLQSMEEHRHAVDPAGDPEELHDFRVCLRRVRALFGQIETSSASSSIVGEFKWLGQVSGDARDLDVLAEDLRHALRQECGQYGAVHPQIEALVECRRLEAHRRLGDALASKRYARLLRSARRALRSDALTRKEPGGAGASARPRLCATTLYRKALRQGHGLGPSVSDERFHRLRKTVKKLRYLLEARPARRDGSRADNGLKSLKDMQTVLGKLNDVSVQGELLQGLMNGLDAEGEARRDAQRCIGALLALAEERRRGLKTTFTRHFEALRTSATRRSLLGSEPRADIKP